MLKFLLVAAAALITHQGVNAATTHGKPVDYTVFQSSNDPSYSVRFVNPRLCDPNVTQYSGYLDMGPGNHYFFWFFESKNNPKTSPLTAWLNGGPGCSSMIGLWQENGPCRSDIEGKEIGYNPDTWTQFSNMIFIDQPNGVGYSYGNPLQYHVEEGATLFYEAIQLFYEAFPQYSKLPFHLFGESFAGRYIPYYADYITQQNLQLSAAEFTNSALASNSQKLIPIDSVGIGNGWINPLIQFKHSAGMACDSSYGQLVSKEVCEGMKNNYLLCSKLIEDCYAHDGKYACLSADRYCTENVEGLFQTSGRNYYDVRKEANAIDPPEEYVRLLNHPEIQRQIGVESIQFEQCADRPYEAMNGAGEGARDSSPALISLLEKGVRVLSYVGDADYLCNWYGNFEVLEQLQFNGSVHYGNQTLQPWISKEKEVGQMKSTDQLTFIRIYDAGHEVPYYQPENALTMFRTWINGEKFNS